MSDGCCMGCTDRKVGCHSSCDVYAQYLKKLEVIKKKQKYDSLCRNDSSWGYFPRRKVKGGS